MRRGPVRYSGHPVRRAVVRGLFRLLQFAALAAVAIAVVRATVFDGKPRTAADAPVFAGAHCHWDHSVSSLAVLRRGGRLRPR